MNKLFSQQKYSVNDLIIELKHAPFNLTRNKLIHYEKRKLIKPNYTVGGYRLYSREDLLRLILICYCLDIGFSIDEISFLLSEFDTLEKYKKLEDINDKFKKGDQISEDEGKEFLKLLSEYYREYTPEIIQRIETLKVRINDKQRAFDHVKKELLDPLNDKTLQFGLISASLKEKFPTLQNE